MWRSFNGEDAGRMRVVMAKRRLGMSRERESRERESRGSLERAANRIGDTEGRRRPRGQMPEGRGAYEQSICLEGICV